MVSNSAVTFPRTLAAVMVLLLYAPTSNIATAQASDFGFRFEFGPCPPWVTERLDTFNGGFTANLGDEPVRMSLTDAQMSAIYRTIENIRFFDH